MNSFKKSNGSASTVVDRRAERATKPVGAPVTLLFQHKVFRGNYMIVGGILIVSYKSVSANVELKPGHPEAQARRVLFKLAATGELNRFAAISEH